MREKRKREAVGSQPFLIPEITYGPKTIHVFWVKTQKSTWAPPGLKYSFPQKKIEKEDEKRQWRDGKGGVKEEETGSKR